MLALQLSRDAAVGPRVHVLLATFNGEKYLHAQLCSLREQQGVEVLLYVADDGSTDRTLEIVESFEGLKKVILPTSRRLGPTKNFLRILAFVAEIVDPLDWIAFCDQDDIWARDKLARALFLLSENEVGTPKIYSAATWLMNEQGNVIGRSPSMKKSCGFENVLVQCVAGANTIVMDFDAATLIVEAIKGLDVFSHDWICYQIVTAVGGIHVHDIRPCLKYRQHAENSVGSNKGIFAALSRLFSVFGGEYSSWNESNAEILRRVYGRMTENNRQCFEKFQSARSSPFFWSRILKFFESGVYRQSRAQTVVLAIACVFGKI